MAQKSEELKLQDALYKNLYVLSIEYPPDGNFKNIFKINMFEKPNKEAFHEVVYYLLKTLNPDVIKEKLPSWPILDKQSEAKFRDEVLRYINEINSKYENADVPSIMKSHLITPSGYNFIMFMFKLSQLVLYQHLIKDSANSELLLRIKPSKNQDVTKKFLEEINSRVKLMKSDILSLQSKFYTLLDLKQKHASDSIVLKKYCDKLFIDSEKKLNDATLNDEKYLTEEDRFEEILSDIKNKMSLLKSIQLKIQKFNDCADYIQKGNNHLEIQCSNTDSKQNIDLIQFMKTLNKHLENIKFQFVSFNQKQLEDFIKIFSTINYKLDVLNDTYQDIENKMNFLSENN